MAYYEPTGGVSAASAPPPEKRWRTVLLMVNGIRRKVRFEESTITGLFRPFLQRLTRLQQQSGRRLIVFLAAPPAVGKSTLTLFLEKLSLATPGLTPLQALGLDGFHYHNEYLNTHSCERDGQIIPLYQIKGAPETYDVSHFRTKMRQLREVRELRWPVYDRMQHDVVEDVQRIHRPIILIEGNWLLLRDAPWADARQYADYTVFIKAHPNDLKMRLVNRKMQGGKTLSEAEDFYQRSDSQNVLRVLRSSVPANETWTMGHDGDFHTEADLQKRQDVSLDFDAPMATLLQNYGDANSKPPVWQEGYREGMNAARKKILRQLFHSGAISSKELCQDFNLTKDEIEEILRPDKA